MWKHLWIIRNGSMQHNSGIILELIHNMEQKFKFLQTLSR